MLKLRRELARALTLLEMVSRRERAKRELVRLTALLAERRYAAGDFTAQLPEPARWAEHLNNYENGYILQEIYVYLFKFKMLNVKT